MRQSLVVAASLLIAVAAPIAVSRRVVPAGDGATHRPATATSTVTLPATTTSTSTAFGRTPEGSFEIDMSVLRTADAPDPFVVMDRHQPWMFATNNKAGNVPMGTTATDGRLLVADALPQLPPWAIAGFTWAPAVTPTADGWVLAFTARDRASGRQCIGVATAPTVHGPYSPAPEPLVCHPDQGGSIDPSFASDRAGRRWLLYKSDGNCCGLPTTLHAVPLTSAATTLSGPPVDLITADQPWEGGLVEAPTMSQVGDRWLLLSRSPTTPSPSRLCRDLPGRVRAGVPEGVEVAAGRHDRVGFLAACPVVQVTSVVLECGQQCHDVTEGLLVSFYQLGEPAFEQWVVLDLHL